MILLIVFGTQSVLSDQITLGDFMLVITIGQYYTTILQTTTEIIPIIESLKVSINRVYAFIYSIENERSVDNRDNIPSFKLECTHIKFRNVALEFDSKKVISNTNLDFNFNENQLYALTGDSGIGKSTLMGTMAKLYPLAEGNIFIDNYNINNIDKYTLRDMILVLKQVPEFIPNFFKKLDDKKAIELVKLLDYFGLLDETDILHFIFESQTEALSKLSGGQQQRLYICIGLLNNPKVLVLDETLSGLNEQWINKFIKYVRMNSINVIVITHNKDIIDLTDREINLNFIIK